MKILAYILNISGLLMLILASLLKGERMKKTLFLLLMGNLLTAVGYLCGGNAVNGSVLWSLYDVFAPAYNGLIAHLSVLFFTVAGMIINDRKVKKEALN